MTPVPTTAIIHAAQLIRVSASRERAKTGESMRDLAIIEDGAVVIENERIAWVGPTNELPPLDGRDAHPPQTIDATGKIVLPGLIDSHTHLIFAGTREDEFEQRIRDLVDDLYTADDPAGEPYGFFVGMHRRRDGERRPDSAAARRPSGRPSR